MIGIVIPAHNEEALLGRCLEAALAASRHPGLQGECVRLIAVLDACTDASEEVARTWPVDVLVIEARNVGKARACGAEHLLALGARWLAFTDADTLVSADWLTVQLALNADAVCGTVCVEDWSPHGEHAAATQQHFTMNYCDAEEHRHIHGANLGVSSEAYRRAGGFPALTCSEDVALVEALTQCGARIAWSALPRVNTSARTKARARGGFGDTLMAFHRRHADAMSGRDRDIPAPEHLGLQTV